MLSRELLGIHEIEPQLPLLRDMSEQELRDHFRRVISERATDVNEANDGIDRAIRAPATTSVGSSALWWL